MAEITYNGPSTYNEDIYNDSSTTDPGELQYTPLSGVTWTHTATGRSH